MFNKLTSYFGIDVNMNKTIEIQINQIVCRLSLLEKEKKIVSELITRLIDISLFLYVKIRLLLHYHNDFFRVFV